MEKIQKTNACRLLDRARVKYELIPYPVDESDLSAGHIAATLGEDINRVFKTLVLHGDRAGHFVCVVPGNAEVDLKKAAKASGSKKAEMLPLKELQPLTGYIRGGTTAIAMKKPLPVFLHSTALDFDYIYVSAGQRGLQLKLSPSDYATFTKATITDLITNS